MNMFAYMQCFLAEILEELKSSELYPKCHVRSYILEIREYFERILDLDNCCEFLVELQKLPKAEQNAFPPAKDVIAVFEGLYMGKHRGYCVCGIIPNYYWSSAL